MKLKLWERLYDELSSQIKRGDWPNGARLPSENELSKEHVVSRNVVRAALKQLRKEGFIISKQGGGSIVTYRADTQNSITSIDSISDLVLCFEIRAALESEAAALASHRATAEDLERLREELDRMAHAIGNHSSHGRQDFLEADYRFHLQIVNCAHNPFFLDALRLLEEQIKFAMSLSRDLLERRAVDTDQLVFSEHSALVDAITKRNAEQSRTMARRHLAFARHRLLGDSTLFPKQELT